MLDDVTWAHLVFSIATRRTSLRQSGSSERNLAMAHGPIYGEYRCRVPMPVPFTRRRQTGTGLV